MPQFLLCLLLHTGYDSVLTEILHIKFPFIKKEESEKLNSLSSHLSPAFFFFLLFFPSEVGKGN